MMLNHGLPIKVLMSLTLMTVFISVACRTSETSSEAKAGVSSLYPRLVLLYSTCTLNKNFIEPYHPGIRYTPNLKDFARESMVFLRHQTEVGFSGPAFATLFSGNHVYNHGIYYHPAFLSDKNYLIAEAFRDNGYETFFWNGMGMASSSLNYGQGVDPKNIIHRKPLDGSTLTKKDQAFSSILQRVKSQTNYRAFIQINFTMTHAPYSWYSDATRTHSFCRDFPEECKEVNPEKIEKYLPIHEKNFGDLTYHFDDTVKALKLGPEDVLDMARVLEVAYKSCVHRLDDRFGATMNAIKNAGVLNQSLIAFTADHGEILYRKDYHVKWGHWGLAPEVLDVPFMIRPPGGMTQRKDYPDTTSSVDVFPTIAGFSEVRIAKSQHLDGHDLSGAFRGKDSPHDEIVYSCEGLPHPADMVSDVKMMPVEVRVADTKYQMMPRPDGESNIQLVDSQGNSEQSGKLSKSLTADRKIIESLMEYRRRLIHGYIPWSNQSDREEVLERLRSLGYLH